MARTINNTTPQRAAQQRALKDGKVTATELKGLKAAVEKDGITNGESRQLRGFIRTNRDAFDPKADQLATEVLSNVEANVGTTAVTARAMGTITDPAIEKTWSGAPVDRGITYSGVDGKLFVGGASADDVVQGKLGDCYLLAAMSAIAHQKPQLIEKAIRDNRDGTFTVSLHTPDGALKDVVVDADLPTRDGKLVFATSNDRQELWPSLIEKAFAQLTIRGDYQSLEGGTADKPLFALTGQKAQFFNPRDIKAGDADAFFADVKQALAGGDIMCAATCSDIVNPQLGRDGLMASHAYAVLGVEMTDGQKLVTLRNPWGNVEAGNDGKDDGTFKLPLATFLRCFSSLDVSTAG